MRTVALVMFLGVLMFYILIGAWMEKKKFKVCHETGVVITFGAIFSIVLSYVSHRTTNELVLDPEILFDAFLPLIIFATAYNMRRK